MLGVVAATEPVYDSARRRGPLLLAREGWQHRHLIGLLARREVIARYQRTLIGAGWALITPLAYAAALYAVFSHVARFVTPGVSYVVYVTSGVVVLTFVTQTILSAATAVIVNTVAQRRFHVPVGVFVAANVASCCVALALSTVALLVVQLAAGQGIAATALLLPVAALLLAVAAAGVGLLVGAVAAIFADAMEATRLGLTLIGFLTPVFYPLSIVPHSVRWLAADNPLSRFVELLRDLAYGGRLPSASTTAICLASAVGAVTLGALAFTIARRAMPSVL